MEARRIRIEAWQTGGMSQVAYCREHGLNTKTFGNWVRKHHAGQVIRSPALVPVTIKPMPASASALHLCGRDDHVPELPLMVSPHWLWELLKVSAIQVFTTRFALNRQIALPQPIDITVAVVEFLDLLFETADAPRADAEHIKEFDPEWFGIGIFRFRF